MQQKKMQNIWRNLRNCWDNFILHPLWTELPTSLIFLVCQYNAWGIKICFSWTRGLVYNGIFTKFSLIWVSFIEMESLLFFFWFLFEHKAAHTDLIFSCCWCSKLLFSLRLKDAVDSLELFLGFSLLWSLFLKET